MATLKDIEQAVTDVFRYQNAENSTFARSAVNFVEKVLLDVRESLSCGQDASVARLVRPADKRGVGKRLGEYIYSYDDGYVSAVRITIGQFSTDVLFTVATKPEPGLPAAEHRRWALSIDQGDKFDLGIDLNGYTAFRTSICLAITEKAKDEIVRNARESLRSIHPPDGGSGNDRRGFR